MSPIVFYLIMCLLSRYAGPGMQVAKYEWKQSWANYLASSRGWIVAQVSNHFIRH
jgi:hypothetical protein